MHVGACCEVPCGMAAQNPAAGGRGANAGGRTTASAPPSSTLQSAWRQPPAVGPPRARKPGGQFGMRGRKLRNCARGPPPAGLVASPITCSIARGLAPPPPLDGAGLAIPVTRGQVLPRRGGTPITSRASPRRFPAWPPSTCAWCGCRGALRQDAHRMGTVLGGTGARRLAVFAILLVPAPVAADAQSMMYQQGANTA